ncbi:unnamed protein product [Absidia cylindrospora]
MARFNNQKQQKLITPDATSPEQSDSHHDIKDKLTNLDVDDHNDNHDQVEKEIIYTSFESDSTATNYNDFQLHFADKNHLKHYAHEIIDYTATKIDINQNGAILLTPHFRQLPTELVSLIISYCFEQHDLFALSLVNKQFHAIANPVLWYAPKIQHDTERIKFLNSVVKFPSPTGGFIRKMEFSSIHWTSICLSLLIPHLHHLEELIITINIYIDDANLSHFPRHCPNLTSLQLNCLGISNSSVFAELGQHCHQLRHLTLTLTRYISFSPSFASFTTCPLKTLTLNFLRRYNNPRACLGMMRGLMKLTQLTHLVIINLHACHGRLLFQRHGDIHPPWPDLALLYIGSCENLSDNDLIPFINSHPHLTELRLWNAKAITDRSLLAIGSALSGLTALYLHQNRHISEEGILRLIKKCRQLTSLTLDHCERIAQKTIELDQEALDSYREGRRTSIIC